MTIYQLGATGHFKINHARYTAYSNEVYSTMETARAAIRNFCKLLTTPKYENDTMVMEKKSLHIFIRPLELVNNENKHGKKQRKKSPA